MPAITLKAPYVQQCTVFANFGQHLFQFPPAAISAEGVGVGVISSESEDEEDMVLSDESDDDSGPPQEAEALASQRSAGGSLAPQLSAGGTSFKCRAVGAGFRNCAPDVCLCVAVGRFPVPRSAAELEDKAPTASTTMVVAGSGAFDDADAPCDPFEDLPDDVVLAILQHLLPRDLAAATKTNRVLCSVIVGWNVWERRQAICYHTKASLEDEILGVGFSIESHGRSSDIKGVNAQLDLLSESAFFESGVRRGVWQDDFERWIPLWLCKEHGERAWPRLLSTVHSAATSGKRCLQLTPTSAGMEARWLAARYLDFFGKAMNAFVVNMLKNEEPTQAARDQDRYRHGGGGAAEASKQTALHASERALLGYSSFHHLLLVFCERLPMMRHVANEMVANALRGNTDKNALPDLGVFLALLTVTDQSWSSSQLAWAVLGEALDRNVRWILIEMPYLRSFEQPVSDIRADQICKPEAMLAEWATHTTTSRRVLMFQAYFLTQVGRPRGAHPTTVLSHYNKSLGRPSANMVEKLRLACGEITAVSDWPAFFARIGLALPSQVQVATRLRNAVVNSRTKGYHGGGGHGRGQHQGGRGGGGRQQGGGGRQPRRR